MSQSLTDVIAEAIKAEMHEQDRLTQDILLPSDFSHSALSASVLQAIDQAGYVIVPKEPTEDMVHAAMDKLDTPFYDDLEIAYRAMLSASKEGITE